MTTIPSTAEDTRSPMAELLAEGTQALTALAPIIPGRRQQLQQVLAGVGRRIAVGGPSPRRHRHRAPRPLRFVTVRGAEYFFVPGIAALRFLSGADVP